MAVTPRDWWMAVQAAVLLPVVAVALHRRGLGDVLARVGRRGRAAPDPAVAPRRVGWVVNRVARFGPYRFNCLRRSVATLWLLARAGQPAEVVIGTRRAGDELQFHAWVEVDGVVVNDNADVGTVYTPFDGAYPSAATFVS